MASTFFKRYEMMREDFYKAAKSYPQLKTDATGKAKASGLNEDLKALDAVLDAKSFDVAALAKVFQGFTKHIRSYIEQISYTPGKGIYKCMADKKTPVDAKHADAVKDASLTFMKRLEVLMKDVEGTVSAKIENGKAKADVKKVLTVLRDDVATWGKYLDLPGVKIVADPKYSRVLPNPKSNKPAQDVLGAGKDIADAQKKLLGNLAIIKGIDVSDKKGAAAMRAALGDVRASGLQVRDALMKWKIEYNSVIQEWGVKLKDNLDPYDQGDFEKKKAALVTLMNTVEVAKQKIGTNLELKVIAAQKLADNCIARMGA